MVRILGVEIPNSKNIVYSLTYIYGIGLSLSKKILLSLNISLNIKAQELTDLEINSIVNYLSIQNFELEGDLRKKVYDNIKRLVLIKSYRGSRHLKNLPVRGQRTKTNSKTRKKNKKLW
ncbi:30S ribosomal protein S13 [Candidatus Pinguicoccus supinus]|uniref:Small ribosomal subunit protein uS13 n=1 Tax=Candidatus Pinguicoccus supinus TaxID=2529394 RepID=A0A7T0FXS0_9BACT|nr:30S ribosomal protein S13 [Candidatus Pinguicoccus supinus]